MVHYEGSIVFLLIVIYVKEHISTIKKIIISTNSLIYMSS
jgi:hypothetical protein